MQVKKRQSREGKEAFYKGFTLVELSLSLVLIAVLSLIIALLIADVLSSYRRGLTLNQVNTTGIDIVDDMRLSVQRSSTRSVVEKCKEVYSEDATDCEEDGGEEFVAASKKAYVKLSASKDVGEVPVTGVFCTGTYSYIWNSGYFFMTKKGGYPSIEGANKIKFVYSGVGSSPREDFKLLKVRDDKRAVCVAASQGGLNSNTINISGYNTVNEEPIDLLDSRESGLALYDLTAITSTEKDVTLNGLFYSVSFILGTVQGGINIAASGNFCAPPNDYANQSFDYCSINKFNFAARATGGR